MERKYMGVAAVALLIIMLLFIWDPFSGDGFVPLDPCVPNELYSYQIGICDCQEGSKWVAADIGWFCLPIDDMRPDCSGYPHFDVTDCNCDLPRIWIAGDPADGVIQWSCQQV